MEKNISQIKWDKVISDNIWDNDNNSWKALYTSAFKDVIFKRKRYYK